MSTLVHCNLCGAFPSPQCSSFRLSNCGHVFCKECIDKGRVAKCSRCNAAAPRCITIDRNLNPNLQIMFKKACSLLTEKMDEINPLMKFQSSQRSLRLKHHGTRIKHLQSRLTEALDKVKVLEHKCDEQSRNRPRSRDPRFAREESRRSVSRAGYASELSHHQTMSSTGSHDSTIDPFKTPINGAKRFTTSTPMPMPVAKKSHISSTMNSRLSHSSTIPSLSSVSMEVDDDIVDVTPAPLRDKSRSTQQQMSNMMIDSDSLLDAVPRRINDKTPAPRKSQQSLSMAERLSAPRPKATQRVTQQSDVTSSSARGVLPVKKASFGIPLVSSKFNPPAQITPIRPMHGSLLPSSTGAAMKKQPHVHFKTPAPPAKKANIAPRTVPAGMKTGMGGSGSISQRPF